MNPNKLIPGSFEPISAKLLLLLRKFSKCQMEGQALNSKIKRTYLNPELSDS